VPERIVVALSGGVDSAVAAALLRELGHELVALTLRFWLCDEGARGGSGRAAPGCCGLDGVEQARAVAAALAIPHYVVDCRERFERDVLRPAWDDYQRGRTPNPCVLCNERIKFGLLLEQAARLGAARVATGHYARIAEDAAGAPALLRGRDAAKDQSYFLFALGPEQLARARFPVGELTKGEVRAAARRLALPNAERAESQDACLGEGRPGERGFAEALRRRFDAAPRPGPILDADGRPIGEHGGLHQFTVGQRRGLGVALGQRAWVAALDAERAAVTLVPDERALAARALETGALHWLVPPAARPARALVQLRYRHPAAPARLELDPDGTRARVHFDEAQRAVTPGQAAVLYDGERVLGGGWIERALR
jgi:tRNA-specific 2-thiouridylase